MSGDESRGSVDAFSNTADTRIISIPFHRTMSCMIAMAQATTNAIPAHK
jgi:hypothetical protein